MGEVSGDTILYKNDGSIIELSGSLHEKKDAPTKGIPPLSKESVAPDLFEAEDLDEAVDLGEAEDLERAEDIPEDTDSSERHTESQINQSNYLRYLSELRKADSELALAKAESAELVRLMDSYKEHYCQYEKMIHTLVQDSNSAMKQQLKDNSTAVNQQLEAITSLGRKLKKTSASLDSRIDAEIQRLTKSLADSIEGSIKESCDKELAKVSEATQVLYDYSDKVKQQHRKFERLEGIKFGLFIFSSISSPIVLILMILNMLHII